MTTPLQLGTLTIGRGQPKIAIPLMGQTPNALQKEALQAASAVDLVEWRADALRTLPKLADLQALAQQVAAWVQPLPLLITLRSQAEGGKFAGSASAYANIASALIQSRAGLAIDIEAVQPEAASLLAQAHAAGQKVILSRHYLKNTPSQASLFAQLQQAAQSGADLPKIATTPQTPADVLTLLGATLQASQQLTQPVITMAMGKLGTISRVTGGVFGSAITFGKLSQASAPGQLDAQMLKALLPLFDPEN